MRIFIQTLSGKKFHLEVESFDTIDYVKGLIREKEDICRWEQCLIFCGRLLEESKTLADYRIQNDSIVLFGRRPWRNMYIRIKTSFNLFTVPVRTEDAINDVKALIEKEEGIPVNEQRLFFSGKELHAGGLTLRDYGIREPSTLRLVRIGDADDVVDIAAVKARKKATLLKDKGAGNEGEAVSEVPEVGSKRAREDSSSATPPSHSEKGLSYCGANREDGLQSFWDEEDFGLAWRRSRCLINPCDMSRFESKSCRTLIESVATDCVRTLNVTTFLENQLQEYQDKLVHAENEVKMLTEKKAYVENTLQKKEKILRKLMQDLDVECLTGTSFLQSENGRRHIVSLERQAAKSAVDEFKKSAAFKELLMDRAMSVHEDTVKECQRLLRKSGRVSEDIIQLIDPQDEEEKLQKNDDEEEEVHEDDEEKSDDEEEETEEDDG